MVFYGEYLISFTSGGRLVLPKKLREMVKGDSFVLTRGFDSCLSGYDKEDWEQRSKEFLSSSLINTENIALKRVLFSGAIYIELDEQGRFVLPKSLGEALESSGKAVFVGSGDHFEIWNEKTWKSYLAKAVQTTKLIDNK